MTINPLSDNYTEPQTPSRYLKLETGKVTRIRILDDSIAVAGYEAWTLDNKPLRLEMDDNQEMIGEFKEPIKTKTNSTTPDIKVFWAFPIWNYDLEMIQIWSFTQYSIRKQIIELRSDPDYKNILNYDLKIKKSKTGSLSTNVEYSVLPGKETPLSPEIKEELESTDIYMEELFRGNHPITD